MDDLFDFLLARQSGGGGGFPPPVAPKDSLLFYSEAEIGISIANATKNWNGALYYSTDHNTWTEWNGTTEIISALNNGWHKLYLRGVGNTIITGNFQTGVAQFVVRGSSVKCAGNCNNLLDYTAEPTLGMGAFKYLFYNCYNVSFSITLPATALSGNCYNNMFAGCTSLTTAPVLPATTLAAGCYARMFAGCTSLTNVPALPATTLANGCYDNMFAGCTSLETLPALPATKLAQRCYGGMFSACPKIKISQYQIGEYQNEYRIPLSGTGEFAILACASMFVYTGGKFTGDLTINTIYYTSNIVINP
jgi:hypothetical protein